MHWEKDPANHMYIWFVGDETLKRKEKHLSMQLETDVLYIT